MAICGKTLSLVADIPFKIRLPVTPCLQSLGGLGLLRYVVELYLNLRLEKTVVPVSSSY
jgi:hypothetical protein